MPARRIDDQMRAADLVPLEQQPVERVHFHVAGRARKILRQPDHRNRQLALPPLQNPRHHFVARFHLHDLRELRRHDDSPRRQDELARLRIDHPAQGSLRWQALDHQPALDRPRAQLHRHETKRFGMDHAGQMFEIRHRAGRLRLDERQGHGLPLHDVPLEIDHVVDAVPKGIGDDQDARRQREGEAGQGAANGPPLDVSQRHPKRRGEPARPPIRSTNTGR